MSTERSESDADREFKASFWVATASGIFVFIGIHLWTDRDGMSAFGYAFAAGFAVFWVSAMLWTYTPSNRASAAAASERQRIEIALRRKEEAEAAVRRREDKFAAEEAFHEVGSDGWRFARYKRHRYTVYRETGVPWRKELFTSARTDNEKRARDRIKELQAADRRFVTRYKAEQAQDRWKHFTRSTGITSWADAEAFVAGWLNANLPGGARVTGAGADGGIDVIGDKIAVQVKYYPKRAVGRPAIQQLAGAAASRKPVFFAYAGAGYTTGAIAWADEHDVALMTYGSNGRVDSVNNAGASFLAAIRLQNTQ